MNSVVAKPTRLLAVSICETVFSTSQCTTKPKQLTEDAVEALQEDLSIDEVEALAGGGADVVDDQVDAARAAADGSVQRPLHEAVRIIHALKQGLLTGQI